MRWAQIVVPAEFLERVNRLKEIGGYKAGWRVLETALNLLEKEINSRGAFVKAFQRLCIEHNIREIPPNAFALVGWLHGILTAETLSTEDKNEVIGELLNFITEELNEKVKARKKSNLIESLELGK